MRIYEAAQQGGFASQPYALRIRPEDDMRGLVEVAHGALEEIGNPVDQFLEQAHKGERRIDLIGATQFLDHLVAGDRLGKAHRQQYAFGQHEPRGDQYPGLIVDGEDQRCGQIQRIFFDPQPARRLDFSKLLLRWHAQAKGLLERRPFLGGWIDQIDPASIGQGRPFGAGGGVGAEHGYDRPCFA